MPNPYPTIPPWWLDPSLPPAPSGNEPTTAPYPTPTIPPVNVGLIPPPYYNWDIPVEGGGGAPSATPLAYTPPNTVNAGPGLTFVPGEYPPPPTPTPAPQATPTPGALPPPPTGPQYAVNPSGAGIPTESLFTPDQADQNNPPPPDVVDQTTTPQQQNEAPFATPAFPLLSDRPGTLYPNLGPPKWGGWGMPMGYFTGPGQPPLGSFGVGGKGGTYFGSSTPWGGMTYTPGQQSQQAGAQAMLFAANTSGQGLGASGEGRLAEHPFHEFFGVPTMATPRAGAPAGHVVASR